MNNLIIQMINLNNQNILSLNGVEFSTEQVIIGTIIGIVILVAFIIIIIKITW